MDDKLVVDEPAFTALAERHRRELHVHCYRMLASFDEAEDAAFGPGLFPRLRARAVLALRLRGAPNQLLPSSLVPRSSRCRAPSAL